ncbi:hypothetical protein [Maridesulfovibrio ferrireducens]|uniref:hypothetical protein n=1 Tax=Maridesulfovibrio ferrireducens TaxID=246191 RepID=UPI001A2D201C|nr:hypothetical protein [Maridesulfovibrio ferrireducens]MBI9112183.1 hypothetical protein [Maridesulfovibrio ferrireducens]
MSKLICSIMLAMFLFSVIPACTWMGKQTGKVTESVKESPDDFKEGYEQGKQEIKDK